MAIFFNQASISFNGSVTNSNVTSGEVLEVLSTTKTALSSSYRPEGGVVYAVSTLNSGTAPIAGITVTDDLGAYVLGTETLVPLDYVDGSVKVYINGVLQGAPTVNAGPPLTVSDITLPAGANLLLIYEATANAYAPLETGSVITNTVTLTADTPCAEGPVTASATVEVADFTALSIAKSICPDTVASCEEITYSFVIQNAGNEEVVATDDLIVTDTFTPALSNLTATFNGEEWTEGVNYTYDEATGAFATLPGQITVPAAVFTQDPVSGVVTTAPGTSILTVSGTV